MKKLNDSRGFNLTELLVSMAIMSIVFVSTGAFFVTLNRQYADVRTKVGVNSLISKFSLYTQVSRDCNGLFPSLPVAIGSDFEAIANMTDGGTGYDINLFMDGENITRQTLNFAHNIFLDEVRFITPVGSKLEHYSTAGTATYFGSVYLNFYKKTTAGSALGGAEMRPRTLSTIALKVDAGNNIVKCVGLSSSEFRCISSSSINYIWNEASSSCGTP